MRKISIFNIEDEKDYLKNHYKIDINELNDDGDNALFSADAKKSEWLIRNGITLNYKNLYNGCNALYTEYEFESTERTQVLIDAGININNLNKQNENALFYMNKNDSKILLVESGINIMQINAFGLDALHNANKDFTEFLIKKGINISRYPDEIEDILDMVKYGATANLIKKEKDRLLLIEKTKTEKKNILGKIVFNDEDKNLKKRI